jgi:tetratricopeptide (TPR) repeat protein
MEDYEEALGWIDRLIGRTIPLSKQVDTYQFRGFLNLWLGRFEQSLLDFKKAEEIDESAGNKEAREAMDYWRWIVFLERGDFDRSRENIQRWLEGEIKRNDPSFVKALGAYRLGLIDVRQGKPDSVKKQIEVIKPLIPDFSMFVEFQDLFNYFCDILDFEIGFRERPGDIERFLKAFGEDRAFLAPWSYLWRITQVIQYLNSPPYVRDFIPRAYIQRGELDKAIAAYERLITFNPQSKDRRLIHPLNYYRLGKVYEQKGDKRKAKTNYRKFLDLWKNADPGLPEVEDAKKRLVAL